MVGFGEKTLQRKRTREEKAKAGNSRETGTAQRKTRKWLGAEGRTCVGSVT